MCDSSLAESVLIFFWRRRFYTDLGGIGGTSGGYFRSSSNFLGQSRVRVGTHSVLTVALFLIIDAWKIWLLSAPPPQSVSSRVLRLCLTFCPSAPA